MLNLMTGGYDQMTIEQLRTVPMTARGERSGRWQGIQHGDLVDTMQSVLKREHSSLIEKATYAVSPNGAAVIGGFELMDLDGAPREIDGLPQKATQSVGFVHSNDSRKALTLCFGARVMLCNNGMVCADVVVKRKHTKGLFLKEWLTTGLRELKDNAIINQEKMKDLTTWKVTPRTHDSMLLALARRKILPWRLIGDVDKCWKNAVDGNVDWVLDQEQQGDWNFEGSHLDWYNAATHVAKRIPPVGQLSALRQSFDLVLQARDFTGARRLPQFSGNQIAEAMSPNTWENN